MRKALLICNSQYTHDRAVLPDLSGPEVDGLVMWQALTTPTTGVFEKSHVRVVFERTASEVLELIEEFFTTARPGDTCLLYFSGHGLRSPTGELYLCARETNSKLLISSAISAEQIGKIIDLSQSTTKVVILDCCYSGAFKGRSEGGKKLAADFSSEGRYVLAASRPSDPARDSDAVGVASPFTAGLAAALTGIAADANGDGNVDLDDVYTALDSISSDSGFSPHRNFSGSGSVIVARRESVSQGVQTASEIDQNIGASVHTGDTTGTDGRVQANGIPLPAQLRYRARSRGDHSVADSFTWSIIALLAALSLAFSIRAINTWYDRDLGALSSFSGGYIFGPTDGALLSALLSLLLILASVAEGFVMWQAQRASPGSWILVVPPQPPFWKRLKRIQTVVNVVALLGIFVTLCPLIGYENYGTGWIGAVVIVSLNAAIGIVRFTGYGDSAYFGGAILVFVGALIATALSRNDSVTTILGLIFFVMMATAWYFRANQGLIFLLGFVASAVSGTVLISSSSIGAVPLFVGCLMGLLCALIGSGRSLVQT